MTCASCGAVSPPDARFCFSCGTELPREVCRVCGEALLPGARFCSACGTHRSAAGPDRPVASRRVTSVLFGDLVSFTTLAEGRDHEDVRALLSRYFEECSRVVQRYGGVVEKFIGDAVMAVWGVPRANEDDAERSVRAGLDLVAAVAALGEQLDLPGLAMRVGIVTGEVAVTLGAQQQGMVAGDPVNTASRIQSSAGPGEVWVDEVTRSMTASAVDYTDRGSHALKGKERPVRLWSARAVVASVRGVRRDDAVEAPLAGRARELRMLKEAFHGVEDSGTPALLVVAGEGGVGKTRLAWELEKYTDGLETRVAWHTGRCAAYGDGVAYQAFADALRGRLRAGQADLDTHGPGDEEAASGEDPHRLLTDGLRRYVRDSEERDWLAPRLAVLLGTGSVAGFEREDLFAAWVAFLERVSAGVHPVTWVVDDAQHANESLLGFVEYLLEAARFPLLVVLLTRPALLETHPWLVAGRRSTVLRLGPLAERDMAALVDAMVDGLPRTAADTLVRRCEGLPLHAVETLRDLAARGLVVQRGGRYEVADPQGLDLDAVDAPHSLQALVRARLDALSPDARTVVEAASVLGNTFTVPAVAALCPQLSDLEGVLDELLRREVLRRDLHRTSPEFGRYRFVSAVVPQLAYGTLSRHSRRSLHLAAARYLEDADAEESSPVVARHYLDAAESAPDDPAAPALVAAAITGLERAAARAARLGAPADAAGHLRTALSHVTDEHHEARLLSRIGQALVDAGRYHDGLGPAQEAVRRFDSWGDEVEAARATVVVARATMTSFGRNREGLALLEPRGEALAERDDATDVRLDIAREMARAQLRLGIDPRPTLDVRMQLAERVGDREAVADSLMSLSVLHLAQGAPTLSAALLEAAIDIARRHHFTLLLGRGLTNLTAQRVGEDLERAAETATEAVDQVRRSGSDLLRDYATLNLGIVRFARGDWAGLRDELVDPAAYDDMSNLPIRVAFAMQIDQARGDPFEELPWSVGARDLIDMEGARAWQDQCEAMLARRDGDLERARELAVRGIDALHRLAGLAEDTVMLWVAAAEIVVAARDEAALERMLHLTVDGQVPPGLGAHQAWARGAMALWSSAVEAEPLLRQAVERYEAWGSPVHAARARADLGTALIALHRPLEAAPLLDAARSVFTALGATAWLDALAP